MDTTQVVSQRDMSIYAPALRNLYLSGPSARMTPHQFVAAYQRRNPDKMHLVYQPFSVPMYTRSHGRRARMVCVNPNSRNAVDKFLWDVRHAFAHQWDEFKHRVDIFINGHPLDRAHFVPALRTAAPYSVQVVPNPEGPFVLPAEEPIDKVELEQRRQREARRRAQLEATAPASVSESPEARSPVVRVRDAIGSEFADRMTALSERANKAQGGGSSQFRIVASPQAARVNAIQAVRDSKIYSQLGYNSSDDFFKRYMNAQDPTALTNALSHEMAAQMRKMPSKTTRFDPQGLRQLYKTKAISGPLMTQWADTVKGWFGQAPAARRNTDTYRVANDYSLAVADGRGSPVSAQFPWQRAAYHAGRTNREAPANADESPFAPFAFEARTERAENRMRRYADDAEMVRRALVDGAHAKTTTTAPVSSMPTLRMPGDSLAYGDIEDIDYDMPKSMPKGEPIGAALVGESMPKGEPIGAALVGESMPKGEPIGAALVGESMPKGEPIGAALVGESMPKGEPIDAALMCDSMPKGEPIGADQSVEQMSEAVRVAAPIAAPISAPVFSSMPHVVNHSIQSVVGDPLAEELARDVIASTDYSGVVVPDATAMPESVRRQVAEALRNAAPSDRATQVKPYLLQRVHTSGSVNALLSDAAEDKTPIMAANMRSWVMSSDGRGGFKLHRPDGQSVDARVVRIKERPEAVIMYSPLSAKDGQH